jgi:hypothetical protein
VQLAGQLGERERVVAALEQQILGRLGELGVLAAGGRAPARGRRRPADRACDELGGRLLDEQRVVEAAREAAGGRKLWASALPRGMSGTSSSRGAINRQTSPARLAVRAGRSRAGGRRRRRWASR